MPAGDPHYWSYRALMEDKKRCLTDIPRLLHEGCNSLEKQGLDAHRSQRAMDELKRYHKMDVDREWDRNGQKTPPHAFLSDENKPHFSSKELAERKKRMQTEIRATANPRPEADPKAMQKAILQQIQNGTAKGAGSRQGPPPDLEDGADMWWEAPTMNELMKPGTRMQTGLQTERAALQERRSSSVPHTSHELLNMKKRFHATKIHQKPGARSQSAREIRADSEIGSDTGIEPTKDPHSRSYQGSYPHGTSSEAWPEGREDAKKVGRYKSQAYFAIDKRRHAANVDGSAQNQATRDTKMSTAETERLVDEQGFFKPDFCARDEKYRSQYALTQHKKRHLANLHHDAEASGGPYSARTPNSDGTVMQDLFTSHKNLDYGKRGHVVSLNSQKSLRRTRSEGARSPGARSEDATSTHSAGSSSCDVGKGISRMMHKHREDQVHTSQVEFYLKKKNHATSVHRAPRPPRSSGESEVSQESNCGAAVMMEKRRPSNPHNSCKAFALKKKYHQTGVHVKAESRLHPETMKEKPLEKNPKSLVSQGELNKLKKLHSFQYNPETREKPAPRPIPVAPVPRNGQWTPQHVCD